MRSDANTPPVAAAGSRTHVTPKEVIFDPKDDRGRVADTSIAPYSGICLLNAFDANGAPLLLGTGWCLQDGLLITAAHVVFDRAAFGAAGTAPRVLAFPRFNAPDTQTTPVEVAHIAVHPIYQQTGARDFDFALLRLAAPLAGATRFAVTVLSDAQLVNRTVNVTGYPLDKGGLSLWEASGPIRFVEPQRLFHRVDTDEGQSGSPVWFTEPGVFRAVGVHVHGTSRSPDPGVPTNMAARFTQPVIDWIFDNS